MRTRITLLMVLLLLIPMTAVVARGSSEAQDTGTARLNIMIRGVEGGVNAQMVEWIQNEVIPGFEGKMRQQGQDVRVGLIQFGGSDEALEQQYALDMSVGEGADILAFDGFWIPDFVEAGYLRSLDAIAGEAVWDWSGWSQIPEGLQNIMGFGGEIYGLGIGTDVRKIYYREDLFREAGISVPWQPSSWDEIISTAQQLQQAGVPTPFQLNAGTSMGEATTMQGYFMALLGAGAHMYNVDRDMWYGEHPSILQTLEFYHQIYRDLNIGDANMQLAATGRDQSFEAFRDGRVAMLVEGDWFWRSVMRPGSEWEPAGGRDNVVRWARMPARTPGAGINGQDYVSISGGTGMVINPNTRNPQLAWELLAYMHDVDMQMAFQRIQPRMTVRQDIPVMGDDIMSAMGDALLQFSTVRPQLPEYSRISNEAQRMTERVVSGEMTPQQAMVAYADALEEIVGSSRVIR